MPRARGRAAPGASGSAPRSVGLGSLPVSGGRVGLRARALAGMACIGEEVSARRVRLRHWREAANWPAIFNLFLSCFREKKKEERFSILAVI